MGTETLSQHVTKHQREIRARQFASQIFALIRDFVPADATAQRRVYDTILEAAFESNALIVNLPPEYDGLTEAAAKRKMIDQIMRPLIAEVTTSQ